MIFCSHTQSTAWTFRREFPLPLSFVQTILQPFLLLNQFIYYYLSLSPSHHPLLPGSFIRFGLFRYIYLTLNHSYLFIVFVFLFFYGKKFRPTSQAKQLILLYYCSHIWQPVWSENLSKGLDHLFRPKIKSWLIV